MKAEEFRYLTLEPAISNLKCKYNLVTSRVINILRVMKVASFLIYFFKLERYIFGVDPFHLKCITVLAS